MGKMKTAFVGEETGKKKSSSSSKTEAQAKVHLSGLKGGQRVKMVEALPVEESVASEEKDTSQKGKRVKVRSKKYLEAKAKIENGRLYPLKEAVKIIKSISYSRFEATVELHLTVKKAGTSVQITLPHSAGRQKKVEVASEETIEKLRKGKVDFDVLVATPEMMPKLVPFAKILGPKGLMPNPKNGTLVPDVKKAKSFSANSLTLKTEKEAPLIHTVVGKVSQKDEEIVENVEAILKALGGEKLIARAFLKSTMSPSVKLQLN